MASLEKAERLGGFTLLGIPVLDAAVFALDNYARWELLVRLHDALPSFLLNPIFIFGCLCLGIYLLDSSYSHQFERIATKSSSLVGVEKYREEKAHGLLRPFLWMCCGVAFVTPLVALAYSLAYKGTPPLIPLPVPLALAYTKTPTQIAAPRATQRPSQSCPNGICIGGNNAGNPSVINNYGPPQRRLTQPEIQTLATLHHTPLDLIVWANAGDKNAWNLGEDICMALRDGAHWRVAQKNCVEAMIPGEASSGIDLAVFVNPLDMQKIDQSTTRIYLEGVTPLVTKLRSFGLSVFVGPSDKVPKNFVKIVME